MLNVKIHILLSNSPPLSPPLSPSRPLPTAVGGGGWGMETNKERYHQRKLSQFLNRKETCRCRKCHPKTVRVEVLHTNGQRKEAVF